MATDPWHIKLLVVALAWLIFTIGVLIWYGIFEFFGWLIG